MSGSQEVRPRPRAPCPGPGRLSHGKNHWKVAHRGANAVQNSSLIANRRGANLSVAAGALNRSLCGRRRDRRDCAPLRQCRQVPDRPARRQRSGRRAIDRAVAAARHFVQRAEGALSQLIRRRNWTRAYSLYPATRWPDNMFLICSQAGARVNLELCASQAAPRRNVGEAIANKTEICGRVF